MKTQLLLACLFFLPVAAICQQQSAAAVSSTDAEKAAILANLETKFSAHCVSTYAVLNVSSELYGAPGFPSWTRVITITVPDKFASAEDIRKYREKNKQMFNQLLGEYTNIYLKVYSNFLSFFLRINTSTQTYYETPG